MATTTPQPATAQAPHFAGYGRPIMIVGMPRSGTTWLGKLFDSHPDTLYLHEPDSSYRMAGVSLAPSRRDYDQLSATTRDYIAAMLTRRDPRTTGKLPQFRKSYQGGYRYFLRTGLVMANRVTHRLRFSLPVPDFARPRRRAQVRPVLKSIESTGRVGLLVRHLGGPIVILLRHPCGQIASTLNGESKNKFSTDELAADDLDVFRQLLQGADEHSGDVDLNQIQTLPPLERLAWRWRLLNDKAVAEAERHADLYVVRYEDLCARPESTLRQLFTQCDLDLQQQTLNFIAASTSQSSDGYYSVYKNPQHSAQRWRQQLSGEQAERIRRVVHNGPAGRLFADDF